MAYSELIKNFERIRSYMRDFYVYGFKSREGYQRKSARSYDDERRRIESYLGDYMRFRQTPSGKNVFLSIDSRRVGRNPLYKAFLTKSFTNIDITLHFILFDILESPEFALSISEITEKIDKFLSHFEQPMLLDESTVRKKLKEYVDLGIVHSEKRGKRLFYSRSEEVDLSSWREALEFFSEAALCGVLGSYLLNQKEESSFVFKHHYITHALESEILCNLLKAISEKRTVIIQNEARKGTAAKDWEVIPIKILVSVQNGRRYLMGYNKKLRSFKSYRLDYLISVKPGKPCEQFDELRKNFIDMQKNMWGVRCRKQNHFEHVEFTIHLGSDEEHIYRRLEREKRCGRVERMDENTCRFSADVYDSNELVPWIRTFICRIKSMDFSNRTVENRIKEDLKKMYSMYGLEGEN